MQYTKLLWRDGHPYSDQFDDIYYSSNASEAISGESEFRHVFFKHNNLPHRWHGRDNFVIAELGFGSGLNCLLTIREWLKHCDECNKEKTLHYIAIEKHPFSAQSITELLSRYPALKIYLDELCDAYPPAVEASHSRRLFNNRVVIHFKFMDVSDALKNDQLNVDAWFLDGFSPAKNPAMWSQELFEHIASNSRANATCSTYTAAGVVKRNLQQAGFVVDKVKGHGNKREMLVAKLERSKAEPAGLHYKDSPWFKLPEKDDCSIKTATIIGAGIAGLSIAYSLVQRGWQVNVIDKHGEVQKEASSNPAPIVYPRLSVNNDVDSEFFIAAYCYALHVFKHLQKKSEKRFWFDDGLVQLMEKKRFKKIMDKFQFNADFVSTLDVLDNDYLQHVKDEPLFVKFKSAGVVLPNILCDVIKNACADQLKIIKAEVSGLHHDGKVWQCLSNEKIIKQSAVLVVANGSNVNMLKLPIKFPLDVIRGQVVVLSENLQSQKIKNIVNADVHVTPAIYHKHYLGASYVKNNTSLKVDLTENKKLFESLENFFPDVFNEEDYSSTWLGFRTTSKDRVPVVGAVPDAGFFNKEYADLRHGNAVRSYFPARYLEGLYISAAHGSRGFTSSFLAAEIIAAQLSGQPLPVNKKVMNYLSPSRFIVNNLKRG